MKILITFCLIFFAFCLQNNFAVNTWFKGYQFEAKVITHKYGQISEYARGSRRYIRVHEGDEYSILIKNPLPVRIAVAVSVDGLNIIDGKRKKPAESSKWILEPHASMTLRGWQTGKKSLRRFFFTKEKNSYAKWKEKYDRKKYTRNLGVIGVAYFWDSKELSYTLNPPQPFADEGSEAGIQSFRDKKGESRSKSQLSRRAGTGMGRREYNRVKRVKFHFDTGMYSNKNVLKIFYEFGRYSEPQPFVDENDGFAPVIDNIIRKVFGKKKLDNYGISHDCIGGISDSERPNKHPYLIMARRNVLLARMRNIRILLDIYYAENNRFPGSLEVLIREGYISSQVI